MRVLLDTNCAVRMVLSEDPQSENIRNAVTKLIGNANYVVVSAQVLGECWSLFTRPAEARGGYGLDAVRARAMVEQVTTLASLLPEPADLWREQFRLLVTHGVAGVQTHDCRIAAWCLLHGVDTILTLNDKDFTRYGVRAVHPSNV